MTKNRTTAPFPESGTPEEGQQITSRKILPIPQCPSEDHLSLWATVYLTHKCTAGPETKKAKRRDIQRLIDFLQETTGSEERINWTPAKSREFRDWMKTKLHKDGRRRWGSPSSQIGYRTIPGLLFIRSHLAIPWRKLSCYQRRPAWTLKEH